MVWPQMIVTNDGLKQHMIVSDHVLATDDSDILATDESWSDHTSW